MKKLFAIIATLVVSTFAFSAKAQLSGIEGMPPYKLGVTVGMNASNLSGDFEASVSEGFGQDVKTYKSDYSMQAGFQVGLNLMVDASPIIPNTFARVETKYSMKGAYSKNSAINGSSKVVSHYVEIPVHFGYAWYINDYLSIMAETGPYFAVGFSGKQTLKSDVNNNYNKTWGIFDFRNGNRFDMGWGLQASAMVAKNYQFSIAYDYGFINVTNDFLQNRNLSVGFTWFFESLFE